MARRRQTSSEATIRAARRRSAAFRAAVGIGSRDNRAGRGAGRGAGGTGSREGG